MTPPTGPDPVALPYAAHHPDEVLGVGCFDEPLLGFNLDRFTALQADNPFVYGGFAFNATPQVAAMLWEGKEERMVDHLIAEQQPAAVVADIVAFGRRHAGRLAEATA